MIERPLVLSDDARAELTSAATGAARANRPRWLMYLGALAVAGAVVYTGVALVKRVNAQQELAVVRSRFVEVKAEVDRLAAIKAADEAAGGDKARPDPRMADTITRAATELGLVVGTVTEGDDSRGSAVKGLKRKRYDFKLTNQPAEGVIGWLKRVTDTQPGVQLHRLDITPADGNEGRPGWTVSVTFTRWERAS